VHLKNILMYIQQDATLHSLLYLEAALHVSGGTSTHHQEHKQLYLQHLVFVKPFLLPTAIAADIVVCCPDDGWKYHPKHVEQLPDKINCVTLHLVGYILEYNPISPFIGLYQNVYPLQIDLIYYRVRRVTQNVNENYIYSPPLDHTFVLGPISYFLQ